MLNELIGSIVQVLLFSLAPFIVWYLTARKEESFFSWIGLKRPICDNWSKTLLIALIATLLYVSASILSIRILPEGITTAGSQFAGQGSSALLSVFFYAFIRTGLSEEIMFRGFILKWIQRKAGFVIGNTVQALLFGLIHGLPFFLITNSIPTLIIMTLLPGLFGWYEGWLNEKQCKGSIIPSWIIHGCVNFLTGVLSLF